MELYSQVSKESDAMGERNDCTVKALAICADIPYKVAHAMLKAEGRKNKQGCRTRVEVVSAMEKAGIKYSIYENLTKPNGSRYTPKTIGKVLTRGRYMCIVSGHVLSLVDGQIMDWTNNRQHRILHVIKVG